MNQKNIDYTQLIRNCRRSITAPANIIVHQSATTDHLPNETNSNRLPSAETAARNCKPSHYQKPSCLSTLVDREQRARIRNAPIETTKSIRDLTKVSKNYVNSQASQKLNFVSHKPVFRNLQPINVNDSVLELRCGPASGHTKRKSVTRTDRDPEPVLNDYLQPVERIGDQLTSAGLLDELAALKTRGGRSPTFTAVQDVNYEIVSELFDRLNNE